MSVLDDLLESSSPSLIRHAQLESAAGPMAPVAAAVYAKSEGRDRYRINDHAPVLHPDADGFMFGHSGVHAPSVVISSVAGEASRTEPLVYQDPEMSPWLSAIEIGRPDNADIDSAIQAAIAAATPSNSAVELDSPERRAEMTAFLENASVSSWELSHRHVDGWVRYALLPDSGKTLWASTDSTTYSRVVSADPAVIAGVSLNSLIWGYWLASGATRTHRRARTLSTQIIGSGASRSPVYATKTAGRFPATSSTKVKVENGELVVGNSLKKAQRPSHVGLGAVLQRPEDVPVHFTCESIVSLTSLSLNDLRGLRSQGVSDAVVRGCLGVALVATELAATDLHLRSECDLVEVDEPRWGLRLRGRRGAQRMDLDIDEIRRATVDALSQAVQDGDLAGDTSGVHKIPLRISTPMAQVMLESILAAASKASADE